MSSQPDRQRPDSPPHILTVALEDYYHVKAFNRLIHSGRWYRFENRLEQNTERVLSLLDETNSRATFWVFGSVAESNPRLVKRIADRGHEIGSRGMIPRDISQLSPHELKADLERSKMVLEQAVGRKVLGFRAGEVWNDPAATWIFDLIAEAGYLYDSSFCPWLRQAAQRPDLLTLHQREVSGRPLWVVPVSSFSLFGFRLPMGGNFFRQFPHAMVRRELHQWTTRQASPLVTYFNVWEIDPDQPRIEAAPFIQRLRQYRRLERMPAILRETLSAYRFTSVATWLDLAQHHAVPVPTPTALRVPTPQPLRAASPLSPRLPVTLVIPCFNEAGGLAYLRNTLDSVTRLLGARYDLRFVLVDDASTDATVAELEHQFGGRDGYQVVRRAANGGVAAAIMTGIEAAGTEVVASIDADCSYDPHELGAMLPLLVDGVDLVTASPYHPAGGVLNVPRWRLGLSRGLSSLYRRLLRNQLHTYTSCFRVYRRSVALTIPVEERGFLGVAEFIARMDIAGSKIVEFPTMLEVRILGRSKMRVVRTILGQLRLLLRMASLRSSTRRAPMPAIHAEPAAPRVAS